jgi:hypothetical protein
MLRNGQGCTILKSQHAVLVLGAYGRITRRMTINGPPNPLRPTFCIKNNKGWVCDEMYVVEFCVTVPQEPVQCSAPFEEMYQKVKPTLCHNHR